MGGSGGHSGNDGSGQSGGKQRFTQGFAKAHNLKSP
jgi:hypothetical protein